MTVTYPFLKKPEFEFLSARHHHTDNYQQAINRELVEKGFMVKLSELSEETQDYIKLAGFRHFHPWRLVMKSDSVSTPVRMIVDPEWVHLVNLHLVNLHLVILHFVNFTFGQPYTWSITTFGHFTFRPFYISSIDTIRQL